MGFSHMWACMWTISVTCGGAYVGCGTVYVVCEGESCEDGRVRMKLYTYTCKCCSCEVVVMPSVCEVRQVILVLLVQES